MLDKQRSSPAVRGCRRSPSNPACRYRSPDRLPIGPADAPGRPEPPPAAASPQATPFLPHDLDGAAEGDHAQRVCAVPDCAATCHLSGGSLRLRLVRTAASALPHVREHDDPRTISGAVLPAEREPLGAVETRVAETERFGSAVRIRRWMSLQFPVGLARREVTSHRL